MKSIEAELRSLCGNNSHPEHPLLRVGYAPVSRYPATDFAPWIAQKLIEQKFEDIAFLLCELTRANPGVGIGVDSSDWSDYWNRVALEICNIDLQSAIQCGDSKAILDLRAALIPFALHGSLWKLIVIEGQLDFLARVMSPYDYSVSGLEQKVERVTDFLRGEKTAQDMNISAWSRYSIAQLKSLVLLSSRKPPAENLRSVLRDASVGARQLFFGTFFEGPGQGHWTSRPYGIDEERAGKELVALGLCDLVEDPTVVLMSYLKGDLLSELQGYGVKEGWSKKYIAKFMIENAPQVVMKLTSGKTAVALRADLASESAVLSGWVDDRKVLLSLALWRKT